MVTFMCDNTLTITNPNPLCMFYDLLSENERNNAKKRERFLFLAEVEKLMHGKREDTIKVDEAMFSYCTHIPVIHRYRPVKVKEIESTVEIQSGISRVVSFTMDRVHFVMSSHPLSPYRRC